MVETYHLGSGDHVVCPVEHPEAVYALKRHDGVQKALDEVGLKRYCCRGLFTGHVELIDKTGIYKKF